MSSCNDGNLIPTWTQDPDAALDYQFDWTAWLGEDTIIAHAITTDLTVGTNTHSNTQVTVWLSGGVLHQRYLVTCHITTDGGREDDRSFIVYIKNK